MSTFAPLSVAFICTHNACRSQMVQALAHALAPNEIDARSAGTHPARAVNPDAVRLLQQRGVDTSALAPKPLEEIPPVDMVVTMGCGVQCPTLLARWHEDWGLEDPSGKSDIEFRKTRNLIQKKVDDLIYRVKSEII